MNINQLIQEKREEIITIAAKHGASHLRIFGSVARGEADENSDLDWLIDYDSNKRSPWFPLIKLGLFIIYKLLEKQQEQYLKI